MVDISLSENLLVNIPPSELHLMPERWAGITYTAGRTKPYAVWYQGLIWLYTKPHQEARIGLINAKLGRQSDVREPIT